VDAVKAGEGSLSLLRRTLSLVRARDGRLTRELRRVPGRFGLGQLPADMIPHATTSMVCGFCSTGCGLTIHLRDGEAVSLTPTSEHPVNLGTACSKGWEALTVLDAGDRATVPLLKDGDGVKRPIDWQTAMIEMTGRFRAIQAAHGDDAIAFLSTGQIATEEMALLGALTKFGMGIVHGDGNTRQCMATSAVAYKQAFGFDAPGYTYRDLEDSDCIVLVGSNMCIAHPVLWDRVTRNRNSPQIIVVDPRRTETAMAASLHLSVRPKTDLTLLYGIASLLIEQGVFDRRFIEAHTTGFDDFAAFARRFDVERTAAETGLSAHSIRDTAARIGKSARVSFWWTMGVNQSHQGVKTAQAIINLALLTGNIGRSGTGANSITGQCNAMGSRLFSNTTSLLGGHDFSNADHRAKVADVLHIPSERIPTGAGWAYDHILDGIRAGKIRGLWVIATNPAHSWTDRGRLRDALGRLDFLVVQDMYDSTETARLADLLLPAAGWGEKEGTFINSERRIGLIKKVRRAPGEALADFHIFKLVAHYYGCGSMFSDWDSPEAVFQIMRKLSAGMPCDFTGIGDYRMLDEAGGIQWPFTGAEAAGAPERRLFEDGRFYHADGRARFFFEEPRATPEPPDDEFPFQLLTGRGSVAQWHTQTRTAKSDVLRKLAPKEPHVEIHPADASALGVRRSGEWVLVESRRGQVCVRALLTPTVPQGQLYLPMHDSSTNCLTDSVFDPESRQPAYKACAARVRASWSGPPAPGSPGVTTFPEPRTGAASHDRAKP
jgi:anaerobic selenocysteine-containing dehydrogenase